LTCSTDSMKRLVAAEMQHQPPGGGHLSVCVLDHDAHVHIRFNRPGDQTDDWHQIQCSLAQVRRLLPAQTAVHVHTREQEKRGGTPATAAVMRLLEKRVQRREAAAKAPSASLASAAAFDDEQEDHMCSICHDQMAVGEELLPLPCGHAFHFSCAGEWLTHADTCPTCRFQLTEASAAGASAASKPGAKLAAAGARFGRRRTLRAAGASPPAQGSLVLVNTRLPRPPAAPEQEPAVVVAAATPAQAPARRLRLRGKWPVRAVAPAPAQGQGQGAAQHQGSASSAAAPKRHRAEHACAIM
jgi:hypothetical protein